MSKLEKIIKLVDLLSHRQWVTLETIMNTCEVPKRTAYRYLNTISESDIPVFYDRDRKAYSLSRSQTLFGQGFGLGDTLILVLALRLFAKHVNGAYKADVDGLLGQLLVRQGHPVEEVIAAFEERIQQEQSAADHSSLLTAMLLHAAIRCEKPIQLQVEKGKRGRREVEVERPRMRFRRDWQVVDAAKDGNGADASAASLADVTKVTISN